MTPPPVSSTPPNPDSLNPTPSPVISPAQCRKKVGPPVEPPPFPHSTWTVGLLSAHGRYLTAEAFGNKLNVTGTVLKKKQSWTLVQETGPTSGASTVYDPRQNHQGLSSTSAVVYFRSPHDRYLTIDRSGTVSCVAETPGAEQRFALVWNANLGGSFHLLGLVHSYYLSASPVPANTSSSLQVSAAAAQDGGPILLKAVNKPSVVGGDLSECWSLRLHLHPPALNLRHVNRERYVTTVGGLTRASEALPWGPEALFTLEMIPTNRAKSGIGAGSGEERLLGRSNGCCAGPTNGSFYGLKTHEGTYIGADGSSERIDSGFTLFFINGFLAFRDRVTGKFLAAVGNDGLLKCKRDTVTKEELWTVTGSYPQINLVATTNEKFVSAQRGLDIAANQDEKTESETFQLENDASGKYWRFRTITDKYWSTGDNGGIQISQDAAAFNSKFKGLSIKNKTNEIDRTLYEFVWLEDRHVGIRALTNNKFITIKINRHLFATSSEIGEREKFRLLLANRSFVVIQGPEGYVGEGKTNQGPLDTAKNYWEPTYVEQPAFDTYHLRTTSGLYWHLMEDEVLVKAFPISHPTRPQNFFITFKERSKIIIQAPNGKYLKIGSGKKLEASEDNQSHAVVWNI